MTARIGVGRFALQPLLDVHFRVALLLVAPGELATALITAERFLTGVRAHVGSQVIAPRERAHADATLERLLASVDADVPGELVTARESPITAINRASVRSLVDRRFARPIRILSWLHGNQPERYRALLVNLRENLVALRSARIVLGQLDARAARGWRGLLLLLRLCLTWLRRRLHIRSVTGCAGWLLLQRRFLMMSVRVMVGEEAGVISVLVRRQPSRGGGWRVVVAGRRGWLRIDLQQFDGLAAVRGRV